MLSGCAHVARGPAGPPALPPAPASPAGPRPGVAHLRPAAGYAGLRDSLPAPDGSPLRGRRIAIDPGHGGYFKGCIGVGGLSEAEVNLGVALELDTLLRAQGAAVLLTRNSDRDFLTPADSTLRGDLTERILRANAFAPELFVSIHHNADPAGAHDVNETQTYYKLGDDGASYDAGTDIHRALVRNVGIESQRLLPGNFAVVRGVDAPALLTESSYLTDPDVEAKLRTPQGRRLEAQALDLGIVRFFARRVPVVDSVWVEERFDVSGSGSPERRRDRAAVLAQVTGAFDGVTVRVDGAEVPASVSAERVTALLEGPLPAGPHVASVVARLAGEGSSRVRRHAFEVHKAANVLLEGEIPSTEIAISRTTIPLRIRTFDVDHLALPDSTRVRLHVVQPRTLAPHDTTVIARGGVAWAYFRMQSAVRDLRRTRIEMEPVLPDDEGCCKVIFDVDSGLTLDAPGTRTGFARVMPADEPLRDAPGTEGARPRVTSPNRDGLLTLRADSAGAFHAPRLAGFRAWGADTAWPPRYVAIADGALHGRRIVLDPEGGGDDAAGTGPSGTRAATLNLDVARALAGMLEAAGADVRLTRQGDAAVSELERVQVAEGFRAERYLRIGHAAAAPVVGHYFSSGAGRRWAQGVASAFAELGLADSLHVGEVAKYALTQTSATALYVSGGRVDSAASEARLLAPGACRAEAYALFLALAREFAREPSPGAGWPLESLVVRDAAGVPLAGAPVTLGGALVLQSGPGGRVRFAHTEPGPLEVRTYDPGAGERVRLLDSGRGRDVPGPH